MAAGWQFGGTCHITPALAASQMCSQTFAVYAGGAETSAVLSCTGFSVTGDQVELALSNGPPVTVTLQPCDRITFNDTWSPLFGLLLLLLLAVWCARKVIDMFTTNGNENV